MRTIKITSNPYRKEVSYVSLGEDNQWHELKDDNSNSKLREERLEKNIFAF